MRPWLRRSAILVAVAVLYVVAGKLGLRLAFFHVSATAVWPPTGIALVALLLLGYQVTPAILVGAFLVNLTTQATGVWPSLGIAIGNTLEAVCGAWLVNRYAGGRHALERARDVLRFTPIALATSALAATIGVMSLMIGKLASWSNVAPIWLTWWLGDIGGALVVAPALLLWVTDRRLQWSRARMLEAVALLVGLVLACQLVFGAPVPTGPRDYPLEFAAVVFLVWAAYRLGRREAATAVVLTAVLAVWGTLRGNGPFTRLPSPNEALLLLQMFLCVVSFTTLMLASLVAERRAAEERLRQLVVSDPLTGLGNYRLLIATLEAEIQRSRRSGHEFAVILFDLDGLKRINDRHGHLVGSQALRRVADALRRSSRDVDTGARFGGDEFALVLPETSRAAAQQVAERVAQQLARDGQQPAISVSTGVAIYPGDAGSLERLLEAADRQLYQGKSDTPALLQP